MNIGKLLVAVTLLIVGFACENEEINAPSKPEESSLKFSRVALAASETNVIPFEIIGAGVYEENLYMTVSYTGGEFAHEFMVNWDREVVHDGDKKIVVLNIFHLTDDDNGSDQITDSLFLSLSEMNIPDALLNDSALWYDVVNSSDAENHIIFQANPVVIVDEEETNEDIEMIVINIPCDNQGVWNNLWLKNAESGSDKHYLPVVIMESINYSPIENDKLKISFEYTYFEDSTSIVDCDFWKTHDVTVIKITELEVINK